MTHTLKRERFLKNQEIYLMGMRRKGDLNVLRSKRKYNLKKYRELIQRLQIHNDVKKGNELNGDHIYIIGEDELERCLVECTS